MDREPLDTGRIYTATQLFSLTTAAATEIFTVVASTLARLEILRLELNLVSSAPVPLPNSVEIWRGTSASTGGSTGTAITPVNRNGWLTAPAAVAVVTGQSTTLNSTANTARLAAGAIAPDSGQYIYQPVFPPVLDYAQRFSARVGSSVPVAAPLAATLTFRETGRVPA